MKKYLITLVLISVLALSACGESTDSSKKDHQDDKKIHKTAKEDTKMEHQDDHQKFGFKEDGDSNQSADVSQSSEAQSSGNEQQSSGDSQQAENEGEHIHINMQKGDPSYEEYKEAQKSQYALDHRTPEQKASGAGGGGAGWNYADQDESYEDYVERVREEKAAAGEN
ncbi:hypothetical protein NW133_12025 [Staphylococcus pettenkoferi]|uniref:Lipoprotein n=1 Tax=Staphylococcus pettenkoferi TaxID=170573 RepID=A0ABT4BNH1_9STAP|nr:hypothetical protein [Staphylococcus pettenkoferi]MCY1565356.1 hypothetical protein [Staphylococcus pettenkoferi]MCY1570566.1 hypothetical protein [Staphylococcus pettenkoferi]MCY1584220.1 hypothetical protein [Staphylococcus pettenkoferi]MCY1589645.1 hypothetical protein [Staphylococcus pettenkoferi]MCY1599151.1 hypothetical protein [Staphylococcus pettenkoferi]